MSSKVTCRNIVLQLVTLKVYWSHHKYLFNTVFAIVH